MFFANHMLITTVPMVRVSQTGMKIAWVLLDSNDGPQVRAAKPTMIIVNNIRRREEGLGFGSACDAS